MILSADTNLFLYAANPHSPNHAAARHFFAEYASGSDRFLLCGLVLVEIYMQLRNPAIFNKPMSAAAATLMDASFEAPGPGSWIDPGGDRWEAIFGEEGFGLESVRVAPLAL
jgi:predicted nucleic acid-binding protein